MQLDRKTAATASIKGDKSHPMIRGTVSFYKFKDGTLIASEIEGLPYDKDPCGSRVLGFHIHEGGSCTGNSTDPFADTGSHYNPTDCPHPKHAGDMPPLFSNSGFAWSVFYTERFQVEDIIGRTVIIHDSPDDFTSQPAGNSGKKIACGVIRRTIRS